MSPEDQKRINQAVPHNQEPVPIEGKGVDLNSLIAPDTVAAGFEVANLQPGELAAIEQKTAELQNRKTDNTNSKERTPWYKKTGVRIGAAATGGIVAVAGVFTAASLMMPSKSDSHDNNANIPHKNPNQASQPATQEVAIPNGYIAPNVLASMPETQFETLTRSQRAVFALSRLYANKTEINPLFYTNDQGSQEAKSHVIHPDITKYNPLDIASEDNTDDEVVKQIWFTQQTAFYQCIPGNIPPDGGSCTQTTLDTDYAQKVLDTMYYNTRSLDDVMRTLNITDTTHFAQFPNSYAATDPSLKSPNKTAQNNHGETVTYREFPFTNTKADGTTEQLTMVAVWTPTEVPVYTSGQTGIPDYDVKQSGAKYSTPPAKVSHYEKGGIWQQYQVLYPGEDPDFSTF